MADTTLAEVETELETIIAKNIKTLPGGETRLSFDLNRQPAWTEQQLLAASSRRSCLCSVAAGLHPDLAQCSCLFRSAVLTSRPARAGGAEIVEQEIPAEPGRGQVQVRNDACGICSWDLQTFRIGLSGPGGGAPPGHEGLGTIVKLGEGVRDLKVGDKVTGGGFASVKNLPASQCYLVPEGQAGLADEHWVVEPVACIVTGIDRCEAKPGQRIAIVGCGFMGLMIIQGLKGVGLNQLIALDVDDDRLAMAMEMGATEAHNSAAEGFDEIK